MKTVATIEARMNSTRLPGKVMLPACGKPLLVHLIERLQRVPSLDSIVVATTENRADDPVAALARSLGVGCFRGSEEDVLGRVLGAAQAYGADVIVEITSDCPAIGPRIVQRCIEEYFISGADYASNTLRQTYPGGMCTQVFSTRVLAEVERVTRDDSAAREHVSLPIYEHPERYKLHSVEASPDLTRPDLIIELDTAEDYEMIRGIFEALYPVKPAFDLAEILAFLRVHPEVASRNQHVPRKLAR